MKHIQAIDISAKMIEIEQGKADANDVENITFKRSIIGEFSVPDQTLTPCWGSVSCSFWISRNMPVLRLTTKRNQAKAKQCLLWRRRLSRDD